MREIPFLDLVIVVKNTAPHDVEQHIGKVTGILAVVSAHL